jgi:PII-like signaling protein
MLIGGKAIKVTLYLSDGAKHHGVPVYSSILDFLFHSGVSGATVVKGVAGFGAGHRIHSAHILEISDNLPIKIEFIETREKVDEVLPELERRTGSGLIEVQETTIIIPAKT